MYHSPVVSTISPDSANDQTLVPSGCTAIASVFTMFMVELLFNIEQGRRKATLGAWENEGGRAAADTAQDQFSINTETGARCRRCRNIVMGQTRS